MKGELIPFEQFIAWLDEAHLTDHGDSQYNHIRKCGLKDACMILVSLLISEVLARLFRMIYGQFVRWPMKTDKKLLLNFGSGPRKEYIMLICGCGTEMSCCKTGITIKDDRYHQDSRFAGDMFYCPACGSTMINRNDNEYFSKERPFEVLLETNDAQTTATYDDAFAKKLEHQYKVHVKS